MATLNTQTTGRLIAVFLMAVTLGVVPACNSEDAENASRDGVRYPLRITATTGMVGDIARQVAGDRAVVTVLMGAGVDPHLYKASRVDIVKLRSADLIFYNGLLLEGKMSDVLKQMSRGKPVVAVTERVDASTLIHPDAESGHADPHLWMDPLAWASTVDVVTSTLAEFDPSNAEVYRENAEAYKATLRSLHAYGEQVLGSVPESRRVLVTSHDAFNYFGRAFGLEVIGVQGLSTESEAGLVRTENLVSLLVERNIESVFVESSVSHKSIESLVEGVAAKGGRVTIGGELFSDAMGDAGTYEGTYVGMLDHNITLVARGLGGSARPGGMQGKLSHGN